MPRVLHVRWCCFGEGGKIGVAVGDTVRIQQLSGAALPASLLYPVLQATLRKEDWEEAERLWREQQHPWRIRTREGSSGAVDYIMEILVDKEWRHIVRAATVHVSMRGKLNEGFGVSLEYLLPLLAEVVRDFPPPPAEKYELFVYAPPLTR